MSRPGLRGLLSTALSLSALLASQSMGLIPITCRAHPHGDLLVQVSFNGRECRIILANYPELLEAAGVLDGDKRQLAEAAFSTFVDYHWESIRRMQNQDSSDERESKALRVQQLAWAFDNAFVAALSAQARGIYNHCITHHVADLIRAHGDRIDCCTQSQEQKHQMMKKPITNKHVPKRLVHADGSIEITKPVACPRLMQAAKHEAGHRHVDMNFSIKPTPHELRSAKQQLSMVGALTDLPARAAQRAALQVPSAAPAPAPGIAPASAAGTAPAPAI